MLTDDSDAATGQLGEILVRSDLLMSGSLNHPAATAAALVDGWLRTGDAGRLDEGGWLCVADRIQDMIVSGAENLTSIKVARVLFMHPAAHAPSAMGRGGACGGGAQAGRQRQARGAVGLLPSAHRRLEDPAQPCMPQRGAAGYPGGQGALEAVA